MSVKEFEEYMNQNKKYFDSEEDYNCFKRIIDSIEKNKLKEFLGTIETKIHAKTSERELLDRISEANNNFLNGEYDNALLLYSTARENLRDEHLCHLIGLTFQKLGLDDDAISEFKAAIEINPNYAEALYKLSELYEETDELVSMEYFDRANSIGNPCGKVCESADVAEPTPNSVFTGFNMDSIFSDPKMMDMASSLMQNNPDIQKMVQSMLDKNK